MRGERWRREARGERREARGERREAREARGERQGRVGGVAARRQEARGEVGGSGTHSCSWQHLRR